MYLHDSLTHMQLKSEMKFSLFFIKLEVKLLFSVGPHSVDGGGAIPGVLVGGGVVLLQPPGRHCFTPGHSQAAASRRFSLNSQSILSLCFTCFRVFAGAV